jgi:regulator of protease activity HflC (stomatin/prohibitin superfamily)
MLLDHALIYLTYAAWTAAAGFVLILFLRTWQREGVFRAVRRIFSERMFFGLVFFALLLTLALNSLVFIQPQEVGVVVNLLEPRGYREQPAYSGLNWITPFVARVYRYPIFWQTYTMSSTPGEGKRPGDDSVSARTSDGQEVFIDLSLIYALDPTQAVRVHIGWQDRYPEELIRPLLRGVVRSEVSQFTVHQVNSSERAQLEANINTELANALNRNGFVMQRFLLREIEFSPAYAAAVEEKQAQEENVTTSSYRAEQARLLAAGEADALERLGTAIRANPQVLTLRYIDKLAPNITVMLLPNNAPFIFPFPGAVLTPTLTLPTPTPGATTTP